MKIVYYFDSEARNCPVKNYLEKYRILPNDSLKNIKEKESLFVDIRKKIDFVLEKCGRPVPPISKALKAYNYLEIRTRKNQNILIRIFYFRKDEFIVLLNAIEKSDHDSKKSDKNVMKKCLDKTSYYQIEFINNPKLYEEYI